MQQTKTRCVKFKLARSSNVAKDLKVFPSSGVIKVAGRSFKILKTSGDGHRCKFFKFNVAGGWKNIRSFSQNWEEYSNFGVFFSRKCLLLLDFFLTFLPIFDKNCSLKMQ